MKPYETRKRDLIMYGRIAVSFFLITMFILHVIIDPSSIEATKSLSDERILYALSSFIFSVTVGLLWPLVMIAVFFALATASVLILLTLMA